MSLVTGTSLAVAGRNARVGSFYSVSNREPLQQLYGFWRGVSTSGCSTDASLNWEPVPNLTDEMESGGSGM